MSRPGPEVSLLVARCDGPRCAALLRLRNNERDPLREAVAVRRDGILLHTTCLGPCAQGAVAAVGWAHVREGGLRWTEPPVVLGRVDVPARAADVAGRISRRFPDGGPTSRPRDAVTGTAGDA